jgi:hypothetical protein
VWRDVVVLAVENVVAGSGTCCAACRIDSGLADPARTSVGTPIRPYRSVGTVESPITAAS